MANHENRPRLNQVHLFIALKRKKDGQETACIRTVIKDEETDLNILISKLKILGGFWRICKTINMRDAQKAQKILLHRLIETTEFSGCIDSLWRTALLQSESKAENNFLLDVDTQNKDKISLIESTLKMSNCDILQKIKTPNGYHYITKAFDTRLLKYYTDVTVIRDGYVYVCSVGDKK